MSKNMQETDDIIFQITIEDLQSEAFARREKMLKLREDLLSVEESRLSGSVGSSPEELEKCLNDVIAEIGVRKNA